MATQRENLLAQARRARQLEMKKASRIRREQGIEDLGKYAPRAPDLKRLKGYTNRQLEVYIAKSEEFRSRSNQFVKLGKHGVTTREKWSRFDQLQQAQNQREVEQFEKIKDIYIPSLGQTIGDRHHMMKAPFQRQMEGTPTGYGDPLTPEQIVSEDAMKRFERRAKGWASGELDRKYRNDFLASVQGTEDIFDVFTDGDVVEAIKDLSPGELSTLLNIRDFAHNYFHAYETYKQMDENTPHADAVKLERQNTMATTAKNRVLGLINDVKNIPGLGG